MAFALKSHITVVSPWSFSRNECESSLISSSNPTVCYKPSACEKPFQLILLHTLSSSGGAYLSAEKVGRGKQIAYSQSSQRLPSALHLSHGHFFNSSLVFIQCISSGTACAQLKVILISRNLDFQSWSNSVLFLKLNSTYILPCTMSVFIKNV